MEITSAEFVISNTDVKKCPAGIFPEYAFIGRSNVGKSSLINMLTARKGLAMTSATPGKTMLINHFLINKNWYLVDLPGYGYAQVSVEIRAKWGKMVERYLHTSKQLRLVFLLIDIRHEPSENDCIMYDWIVKNGYEPVIIATKLDKIKRSQIQKNLKIIRQKIQPVEGTIIIPFSAQTKQGKEEILQLIEDRIAESEPESE